jgi:predicted nucleic acid-binding protein
VRVLIDSDVLLDVALGREPWGRESRAFLEMCERGEIEAFVAWHSLSNVYYMLAAKRQEELKLFLSELLGMVRVAPVGHEDMIFALEQETADFEDATQVAAAVACRATRIVTRNTRYFKHAVVPAVTPGDLVRRAN